MNDSADPGSTSAPFRMEVVDLLRGLAALSVSWFHLTNTYDAGWVRWSGHYGWLGVEVFFVISGFVIPYAIARSGRISSPRDFGNFMLRRMIRLEPPYIASIMLVVGLAMLSQQVPGFRGQEFEIDPGQILAHFLYLVPATEHRWLSPVYWTLAYEFAFYISCGLLFGILGDTDRSWLWHVLWIGLAGLTFGALPGRTMLFVMGIAVFRHRVLAERTVQTLLPIAGAFVAIALNERLEIALAGAATALVIMVWGSARLPSRAPVRIALWFGTISYSLYLVHVPIGGRVVNLGERFIGGSAAEMLLLSLAALVVAVLFAAGFARLVERPALRAASRAGLRPATTRALP